MRIDGLREYGTSVEVDLPTEIGLALARTGLVDANQVPGTPMWSLKPTSKVGAVSVGGVEVHVAPKVPIDRVVFMLAYGHRRVNWRHDTVRVMEAPDLLVTVVEAFERLASRALLQGLLQGYRAVDESLMVVRGRIREADQVKRRFALPLPIEVTYDDFTVDTPENRVLRWATHASLRLPALPDELRRRLRRLNLQLSDVSLIEPKLLEPWRPSRLNARLHDALRLAEIIIDASSFEPVQGDLTVTGFVVDMAQVFEDFVCTTLGERLQRFGGYSRTQDPWHLDRAARVPMQPDLVWYTDVGMPAAVVDAKYKAEKPQGFPNSDLYQMHAYCTAMRLPIGHLVYAKGNEHGTTHQIAGDADVTLRAHTLDLSAKPSALLTQIEDLAGAINRQTTLPSTSLT